MLEILPHQLKCPCQMVYATLLKSLLTITIILQVENDELVKPISSVDAMRYKDCPVSIDDKAGHLA